MISNKGPTNPRSTPEEEGEAMEEEASPGDVIRDISMDTREAEVVTNRAIKTSIVADTEENSVVVNLTNHPQKGTPGSIPKTKDADKDRCRYCHEIGHWERECPQKKKDESKSEEPKPYGAFSGLSDALPEFYGQAALSMGNPAIGEDVSRNH